MDKLKNLKRIFNGVAFRIPDYQRGYSWGEDELNDLWDDLESLLPGRDHYTGMLSLKLVNHSDIEKNVKDIWTDEQWIARRGDNIYEIVDGQQRLTTLIILINEIVNYCINNNLSQIADTKIEDIKNTYLFEDKPSKEPGTTIITTYKFGYEADNPSYDYFRNHILNELDDINAEKTLYTKNLRCVKDFFRNRLKLLSEDKVEDLFSKITQHLMFNIHEIEDNFNVFVAFETMNNRGKKLSSLELLKNRLIYLTTLFNNDEDEKEDVRKQINKTWKDIYEYLGKNQAFRLEDDDYLRLHWIIYFGFNTRKDQGNKTISFSDYLLKKYFIQQRINNSLINLSVDEPEEDTAETGLLDEESEDDSEENSNISLQKITPIGERLKLSDIKNYVESLREFAPFWYKTYTAEGLDEELSKRIFRLNTLGYVNARPLVTVLFYLYSMTNPELILKCVKKIERFNFLNYGINGITTTYMNSTFYNLARDLYYDEITIEKTLETLEDIYCLASNNVVKNNGPIERFEKFFKRDGFYSWPALKYLLYIYDIKNKDIPAEQAINPKVYFAKDKKDKYTVEHIYPQKANDAYWTKRFTGSPKECKILSSSLGNLLPLSGVINSTLQNKSFTEKKERYEKGSSSEQEVARWDGGEWNPQCILDRGMQLLNFMESEFDFKFPNDFYRKKILGLDFMADEENDSKSNATDAIIEDAFRSSDEENYSEQDHLNRCTDAALAIYMKLKSKILGLGEITIVPKKLYLAFKHITNVCDIQVQSSQVKITINVETGKLNDPKRLAKDMKTPRHIGHWGNGDYELVIDNLNDIDYAMGLIEQSYKIH